MADAREDLLELYRSAPVTAPVAEEVPPRIRGLPMLTRVFEDPLKTEARWGRMPGQSAEAGGWRVRRCESVEWLPY